MKGCVFLGGFDKVNTFKQGEDNCRREKCSQWIPEAKECAFVVTARKLTQLADLAAALKMFAPKPK